MDQQVAADCRRFLDLIRHFRMGFGSRLSRALLQGSINMSQFNTLTALQQTGKITMGELARRLHVTMGASTNVVDRLVKSGYVDRTRSEEDRRVVYVELTPRGEAMLEESAAGFTDYVGRVFEQLDPAERAAFLATYAKIADIGDRIEVDPVNGDENEGDEE